MYHAGSRALQDFYGSRRVADLLEQRRCHTSFNAKEKELIESLAFFFIATASAQGKCECSIKSGEPGFARVLRDGRLAFPDYDGNGMYKTLGNILAN